MLSLTLPFGRVEDVGAGSLLPNALVRIDSDGEQAATNNSDAIRDLWKTLHEAAATERTMLIAATARRWDVDAWFCHPRQGEVIHTTTWRKLRYGKLAAEAARIPIPKNVELKQPVATALRRA